RVDYRPSAEPLRVEIERADLRSELDDMGGADFWRREQRTRSCLGRLLVARDEAPARARRQVDDQVGIAGAHTLDHLPIVFELHAGPPAVYLAHVDVADGGTCLCCTDAGLRDLLRRDRERRVLCASRETAGDGAGQNGRLHASSPDSCPSFTRASLGLELHCDAVERCGLSA